MRLVVSSGQRPVTLRMPRVEGMSKGEAESLLVGMGLVIERIEAVNLGDPQKAGRIVSQEPRAGYPIERGGSVTLSAAAGVY